MTKQSKVRHNLDGLENIRKAVGKTYRARVGILGSSAARNTGDGLTNAEIGVLQIFGSITRNIPPRDFLIMPIQVNKREIVQALGSNSGRAAFAAGDYKKLFQILGIAAEGFVHKAFDTGGFGHWAPNAPSTIAAKGSDKPLIDTRQLERSITSDVVKSGGAPALAVVAL